MLCLDRPMPETNPFDFENLARLREEREMSMEDVLHGLSHAGCRISRPTYADIESGKTVPRLDVVDALVRVFDVPRDFFWPETEQSGDVSHDGSDDHARSA